VSTPVSSRRKPAVYYAWTTVIGGECCCAVISVGRNRNDTTLCLGKTYWSNGRGGGLCGEHYAEYTKKGGDLAMATKKGGFGNASKGGKAGNKIVGTPSKTEGRSGAKK
jgi:hypothetical protein